MLGGNAELVPHRSRAGIALLHQARLGNNLSGVTEKFLALRRQDNAFVGTLKNCDAKLMLQFPDSCRQTGLGNIQLFSCPADAPGLRGLYDVF